MNQAALDQLYKIYGKETVEEKIRILNYKVAPQPLPKNEDPELPVIYVFRHGQSQDNLDMIFSGWRESQLTPLGMQQALEIAPKLRDKKIQMLISSPQIRCVDTMRIATCLNDSARKLEIHTDPRLKERCYGELQGTSKLELILKDPDYTHKMRRDYYNVPPSGESLEMVVQRTHAFLDEIIPHIKKAKINVAISCHGNSIRGIRNYFEKLSVEETSAIETPLAKDYAAYVIR